MVSFSRTNIAPRGHVAAQANDARLIRRLAQIARATSGGSVGRSQARDRRGGLDRLRGCGLRVLIGLHPNSSEPGLSYFVEGW